MKLPTYETWILSVTDSQKFIAALLDPPEPNEVLKAAAVRYKARKLG